MTDTVKSGRWIITGQFQLVTPMHIGTGLDEEMDKQSGESVDKKQNNSWIQAIALDLNKKPYIPGASIKGALKALARRYYCASNLNIFGDTIDTKDGDNKRKSVTVAGQAEFLNAWYAADQEDKPFDTITRVAIDRVTGTAEDRKLFNTRRVNPGVCFNYKIIIQNACETEIQYLLDLLRKAAKDPSFSLGAGANQSQGKVRCLSSCVRYFGKQEMHDWFRAIQNGKQEHWQIFAKPSNIKYADLERPDIIANSLNLPLTLDFHTPFLVKASKKKDEAKNEADAKPRTNHQGQVILPASSLRGRLRAQAEKILRTMGQDIPQGHAAPAYDGIAHRDLISLLFGTAGWKGIVCASDLIHSIPEYALQFNGVRETISDLSDTVKSCIIVDLVKTSTAAEKTEEQLHIRIVDSAGSLIVHKSENSSWANDTFRDASVKDNFKARLKEIADPQDLSDALRADIKKRAFQLATLTRHEMVAIDRFTGGGKEGAKFNVDYIECPTLTGAIYLDLHRLKQAQLKNDEDALKPALGLISLLLRDLAEGDIAFGFGANKGYGQCREHAVLDNWEERLKKIGAGLTIDGALQALRDTVALEPPAEFPPEIEKTTDDNQPEAPDFNLKPASNGFHNPYHFIPLNNPKIGDWPEAKAETLKANREGHDQYHTGKFSGRIVCSLTTQTPLFIGAETKPSTSDREPSEARPFKLNGKHAIPATSLRGMLSSLFESVSNSNFRVLHPEHYSVRKSLDDYVALSAMGRIVDDQGELKLQPLTLPTLFGNRNNVPAKWEKIFGTPSEDDFLRIYFDDIPSKFSSNKRYFYNCKATELKDFIKSDKYFIGKRTPTVFPKSSTEKSHLESLEFIDVEKFKKAVENLEITPGNNPYIHGWVRNLKDEFREDIPDNVKHHVFLPDTTKRVSPLEIPPHVKKRFHELADLALAGLHLKQGETIASPYKILPYTPIGRNKLENHIHRVPNDLTCYMTRLKKGDLVFFDVDNDGQITEISFSSIWRAGIGTKNKLQTTADLLSQRDPNLVQLGMGVRTKNTDRFKLSPAERLFGVVEHRDDDNTTVENVNQPNDKAQAFAFAGKVRIGFGLPDKKTTVNGVSPVTLKELSSPKPPSPAFYLKRKNNDDFVSKKVAAECSETMTLRGRKCYLHAWREQNGNVMKLDAIGVNSGGSTCKPPWKTHKPAANDQKEFEEDKNKFITSRQVKIAPISENTPFYFEIDFNNLDATELAQLCATLQPAPKFEHRLGMGKPLGLGSVKIEPVGLFLINRHQRYTTDSTNCDRYHYAWLKGEHAAWDWPEYFRQNVVTADCTQTFNDTFDKLVQNGLAGTDADIKHALQLLGDPQYIGVPVHYPIAGNSTLENKHFEWFGNNDKASVLRQKAQANSKNHHYQPKQQATPEEPQYLHTITKDSKQISLLKKNKIEDIENRDQQKHRYSNHRR
ncbi:CRISPR-associated protein [Nitrosomonas sp. Nm51]|uniref:TIGR03986 family type III CRISPR-associated RAMP protein n=1 Tax=Nitrosomonas sp. Nm51 TaxID=133720 RepID=UPI0008CE7EB3|nr:TIGR03986 family CRISPR-associated RAMP protein [Nitrosomonas sp. Nm51]SER16298.1 CRISPR-associated protein [Nitrosomonas sp. Nm51]